MYWVEEVKTKLKRKNQVLFSKDSEFLQDLMDLFQKQSHITMTLWAFDFAKESVSVLKQKYPTETRPEQALSAAQEWACGDVKMRFAQRKILDCHAFAKEIQNPEDIAICHAIGQACAVVHTAGHAIGYPIYDLTSIVRRYGIDNCVEEVERRKQEYITRLFYWIEHAHEHQGNWAQFMMK